MLDTIERDVYDQVLENWQVETREMALSRRAQLGAMAFFSEKYGDRVRVVQMGPSIELCGGTHVRSTGQLGLFRLAGQGGCCRGRAPRSRRLPVPRPTRASSAKRRCWSRSPRRSAPSPDQVLKKLEQVRQEKEKLEARLAQMVKSGGGAAARREPPSKSAA